MAPGSKSGLGDIARVRERVREYAKVRARVREYASTRECLMDPISENLKVLLQAGNTRRSRILLRRTSTVLVRYKRRDRLIL